MLYFDVGDEPETSAVPKSALRGIAYSQWAYWCSLAVAGLSVLYVPPGPVRTMVILTPVLPALLCLCIAYSLYRACDEYVRVLLLESVAITAIIVSLTTLAYFILELQGFPHVSMVWVSLLAWSIFNLQVLILRFRSR